MHPEPAGSLARFQDAFARALFAAPMPGDKVMEALVAQPAFAVYRNTVMKGCLDALQANFPAVVRLVGEDWFRAAATAYVAGELPGEPSLLAYGESFPAFLDEFGPARELPYLAAVARLDRLWTQAHAAADGPVLDGFALAGLDAATLAEAVLHPHPAARWAWVADTPAYTLWSRNREMGTIDEALDWHGEGALLTRPADAVRWTAIDEAGCRFLDACAGGLPIAQALDAALEVKAGTNLVRLVTALLEAGAFDRLDRTDQHASRGIST